MAQKGRSWACGFQGGSGSLSRAPGLPLPRAGLSPGGPQQHFLYVLAPFSPSVTSQSPRITASPRHPCSGPESPQAARGSQGKGKRRGRRRHPQEVSRTPAHTTTPVQVVTHPTPLPPPTLPRTPRAGSSRNSLPEVPLNQTMRSKSRKPRRVSGPPISPFATWISILQEWSMPGQRSGSFLGRQTLHFWGRRRRSARTPRPRQGPRSH